MKIFACFRSIDCEKGNNILFDLLEISQRSIAVLQETEHNDDWKNEVEKKMKESNFVVFLLGEKTFKSDHIKWEYAKAKSLNKRIIGVKLDTASKDSIIYCQGFQVFDNATQAYSFLKTAYQDDRQLLIEQYKIMVGSTEKVTEQRLKVHNLFFTVVSSILSVAFILTKSYSFTVLSINVALLLTGLAFLASFFWEKLIDSYGKLNRGKFLVIDHIEKELRSNMFENEWHILKNEIKYEPNSETEKTIIIRFRLFIIVLGIAEIAYIICSFFKLF